MAFVSAAGCSADTQDGSESAESALGSATPLDVPFVAQNPELPRGCEVTSLTMMLRHAGVNVDKMTLAGKIAKVPYSDGALRGDPYEGFVGNMTTFAAPGYGVYHGPIAALAATYLPGRIADVTGTSFNDLLEGHVAQKRPVWVITNATFKPLDAGQFQTWKTSLGSARITWQEHSVVITGFDATTVSINDPLDAQGKNKKLSRSSFRAAWEQMGKQAITYLPATTSPAPLLSETVAACTSKSLPQTPTTWAAPQLAPFVLTASHAIARSDLRPGDALNRNVAAGPAQHFAWFSGWADAAHTAACVVQPSASGSSASTQAYGVVALAELTPIRFETFSSSGWRSDPIGVDCGVHADNRLYCTNTAGAAIHAMPTLASATVNHLRTTYSWFECWNTGDLHAGGNTTWYRATGDDNAARGWVPAVDLATVGTFDADPTAHGLVRCAP